MKKLIYLMIIPLFFYSINIKDKDDVLRIRVIANSNSKYDQNIKENISKDLRKKLYSLLKDEKNIDNARNIVKNSIPSLEKIIETDLNDEYSYSINYGLNYFPKKEYNGKKYEAGNYESLLVTLGEGKGNNWWCILFPPICLIEAEENEKVEYSFFLFDMVSKIFK